MSHLGFSPALSEVAIDLNCWDGVILHTQKMDLLSNLFSFKFIIIQIAGFL